MIPEKCHHNTRNIQNRLFLTLSDPIRTEHEPPFFEAATSEPEHTGDEGQSPQEQPREMSPHE